MRKIGAICLLMTLAGCTHGKITTPQGSVVAVPNAGKPATLDSGTSVASLPIPAGSSLTVTKFEAIAPIAATSDAPAVKGEPSKEVVEVKLAGPTEYRRTEKTVKASTGTVDTSVRQHEIDASESRPLLYAAIAAALGAGFFVWAKYPTPGLACGAASIVFFLAWKVSGLPSWFWATGLLACGVGVALYLGHERGEKSAKNPS